MDIDRLHAILAITTIQLRKGAIVEERDLPGVHVTEINAMPHENEVPGFEKVDMTLLTVGVDKAAAGVFRDELIGILKTYPRPHELAGGPSYITVGAEIGDQGAAFQLFALGKVLGLWDVITPATLGAEGEEARDLAGRGFVMMSGYTP